MKKVRRMFKLKVTVEVIDEEPYLGNVNAEDLAGYLLQLDRKYDADRAAADIEARGEVEGPKLTEEQTVFTIVRIEELDPPARAGYL